MSAVQATGSAWLIQQMMEGARPQTVVGKGLDVGALVLLRADEFHWMVERLLVLDAKLAAGYDMIDSLQEEVDDLHDEALVADDLR